MRSGDDFPAGDDYPAGDDFPAGGGVPASGGRGAMIRVVGADGLAREAEGSPAYSVLVALQRAGVPHRHDCGGKALCGTCRVAVSGGRLSPLGERERARLAAVGEPTDGSVRLACQARPAGALALRALVTLAGEGAAGSPARGAAGAAAGIEGGGDGR